MWKTIVPAAAVLAAEAVIRRKINALPAETFPLRIGQRVQLRRAHNRGLLCSKFARKPRAAAALQTASGSAYTDSSGGWVDPYNTFIRAYLVSLCKELHDLGFDEVAFSYLQQPLSDTEVKYASQSGTPSRTDAVVSLAKYLRANLTATGLRVSAVVSADSILQSRAAQSGQDMAVFPKLFDRVCVFASADNVATLQSAIAADSSFDAATRFVPFLAKAPESGSYVTTG